MPSGTGFWDWLFGGIALMLVVEGVLPLANPQAWRGVFERVLRMTDGQIRFLGLASIASGALMLLLLWL